MKIGTVVEIWRYPVKSMGGETLDRAEVGTLGLVGDRGWALRDEVAQEIRGAKKFPMLLLCRARYLQEPVEGKILHAEVVFPDGILMTTDDPRLSVRLSTLVEKPVTLWPLQPAENLEHYRRGLPDSPDMDKEVRQIFGLLENEPLPNFSIFPREVFEFTSPPGTYFDVFPLHLLTTASLGELARLNPGARFDRRRFRPNFLIEPQGAGPGFVENSWCGRRLRIGEVTVSVEIPCTRCSMTTRAQANLPEDTSILRTLVREAEQKVGVYGRVRCGGQVHVGDSVEVL